MPFRQEEGVFHLRSRESITMSQVTDEASFEVNGKCLLIVGDEILIPCEGSAFSNE